MWRAVPVLAERLRVIAFDHYHGPSPALGPILPSAAAARLRRRPAPRARCTRHYADGRPACTRMHKTPGGAHQEALVSIRVYARQYTGRPLSIRVNTARSCIHAISRGLAGARLEAPPQPRVLRQQSVEDKPARTPVPSPTLRVRASRRHYLRRDRRQRPPRHPHRGRGAKRDPANLMSSCRPHHTAIHRPMGYRRVETATAPPVRTPGCPTHTHPAQPGYPPAPHIYNSRTLADRTQTHPLPPAAMPNAGQ
jgi:hypothetical protein